MARFPMGRSCFCPTVTRVEVVLKLVKCAGEDTLACWISFSLCESGGSKDGESEGQ